MRARAVAKHRHNQAENKKTGGGVPKLEILSDLEEMIIEIVVVAVPDESVKDSNFSRSFNDSEKTLETTVDLREPEVKVQKLSRSSIDDTKMRALELQMSILSLEDLRNQHLSSLKCINELKKMPVPLSEDYAKLLELHERIVAKIAKDL